MKNYLKKYWAFLSIWLLSAAAAIFFLIINQDTLGLICLINMVFYGLRIMFDARDEKEREQTLLISALQRKIDAMQRKVEALDEYIQALAERETLDYEHLKQRNEIIAEAVRKIENKIK